MVRKGYVRIWSDIPVDWKEMIETAAKKDGATSISEYIRTLIRDDLRVKGLLKESRIAKFLQNPA